MSWEVIENKAVNEKYYFQKHKSGLPIFVVPKPGFSKTYALFATNFGSVNSAFLKADGSEVRVPDGTAHFLEHKLFESEEGDAFAQFAQNGANANAYTSFDRTAYLFSATEKVEETLGILLKMVSTPYFTEQSVKKEQGIIGQEIGMYDDDPGWQALIQILGLLYHNNTVKLDIAGSVQSIAEITPEKLYDCYYNFYNLSNMALCVCGDVTPDMVLRVADEYLEAGTREAGETIFPEEAETLCGTRAEKQMSVSLPIYMIGLKDNETGIYGREFAEKKLLYSMCLDLLCGEDSDFYKEAYREGLINSSFGSEYDGSAHFSMALFTGEGRAPDKIFDRLMGHMERLRNGGITKERFEACKKAQYGSRISLFNHVEAIANQLISCYFMKVGLFDGLELFQDLTLEKVQAFYDRHFDRSRCALSIISGGK